ncbi:MAG: T9SS type A sorting domain-containing protein, partial [Pedobacter sp.]
FLISLHFSSQAQVGPLNFIDQSLETAGITTIVLQDLNNDGFNDIITSTTGNGGRIGYYLNQTNNTFSSFNLVDHFTFCRSVAVSDFNNDGLKDFVAIGKVNHEAVIYLNNNGAYTSSVLDTNATLYNEVVVADFDQNNSKDIVIIGQHSIDFFRNNGSGSFTKEVILSTNTSPLPLECLDIEVVNIDNDGDLDIVSGETAGLVVYKNNGNGIFIPNYYSSTLEIIHLIHPFDIDNDGDIDVVARNSIGQVKLFKNDGNGTLSFHSILPILPSLTDMKSVDYNGDGLKDLYVSYNFNIVVYLNNNSNTFSNNIVLQQTNSFIMGKLAVGSIDNQGQDDFVWSGSNNALAFQLNLSVLSAESQNKTAFTIFPNPTNTMLNFSESIEKVTLYNLLGAQIGQFNNVKQIDISHFSNGVYLAEITNNNTK